MLLPLYKAKQHDLRLILRAKSKRHKTFLLCTFQLVEKVCFFKKVLVLYPYKNALWALRPAKPLGVLSRHPCRNPKPLPRGEGLCMLCWLCICAIVVVCCRCVLHRLCSTTCMRPCIEHLGIHARHPCRGYITGATAPRPSKDACSQPHKATARCGGTNG